MESIEEKNAMIEKKKAELEWMQRIRGNIIASARMIQEKIDMLEQELVDLA